MIVRDDETKQEEPAQDMKLEVSTLDDTGEKSSLVTIKKEAADIDNGVFVLSTATKSNSWLFTPPWRAGHKPIKMKDFLRGQKVPLHERPGIPIIYVGTNIVVAVRINNEWIVRAEYKPMHDDDDTIRLCVGEKGLHQDKHA